MGRGWSCIPGRDPLDVVVFRAMARRAVHDLAQAMIAQAALRVRGPQASG